MELSLPTVVSIASVSVFVCILLVILLCILIARRQKNNTSRESQSATEPLRKSYITSDLEAADDICKTRDQYKPTALCSKKHQVSDSIHYLPVEMAGNRHECQPGVHETDNSDNRDCLQRAEFDGGENEYDKCKRNLAINPGVEIYNVDPHNNSRVSGLGKYTFKPRLKYLTSKPYFEIEEQDREKLYVINSYKHCAGKSILPSTLTFDKDPEKFSDKFASDLLCSSTPRPAVRSDRSRSKEDKLDIDLDL